MFPNFEFRTSLGISILVLINITRIDTINEITVLQREQCNMRHSTFWEGRIKVTLF